MLAHENYSIELLFSLTLDMKNDALKIAKCDNLLISKTVGKSINENDLSFKYC